MSVLTIQTRKDKPFGSVRTYKYGEDHFFLYFHPAMRKLVLVQKRLTGEIFNITTTLNFFRELHIVYKNYSNDSVPSDNKVYDLLTDIKTDENTFSMSSNTLICERGNTGFGEKATMKASHVIWKAIFADIEKLSYGQEEEILRSLADQGILVRSTPMPIHTFSEIMGKPRN